MGHPKKVYRRFCIICIVVTIATVTIILKSNSDQSLTKSTVDFFSNLLVAMCADVLSVRDEH